MDAFVGTILGVGFSFPPRGWMSCNGQMLSVSSYSALYALLGTQYGGDGVNTFGLPDLRGRVAVGQNQANMAGRIPGGNGAAGGSVTSAFSAPGTGSATATLTVANLPAHNHPATFASGGGGTPTTVDINVSSAYASSAEPLPGGYLAAGSTEGSSIPLLYATTGPLVKLNAATATVSGGGGSGTVTVGNTGGGTPVVAPVNITTTGNVATVPPFQTIQYIICIDGIFPSRN
jgi:microcystin-dependent protein